MAKKILNSLLGLLTNRVHRRQQQSRVPGPNGSRIIDNVVDDTGVGKNNETENIIIDENHILDCGHPARNNLGGQCHYCDCLVCKSCIFICSSCGHALCNLHSVQKNFNGKDRIYCHRCADEISRSISKLGKIETSQQQTFFRLDSLEKILNDLVSLKDLLEQECHNRHSLTEQHYEQHIIQPMVRTLAPILDMVDDAKKVLNIKSGSKDESTSELDDAICTGLKQFLKSYGIESIKHRPNTRFDPKLMKPIKIVATTDRELDGCVAESLLTGLALGGNRLLRAESVSLYR